MSITSCVSGYMAANATVEVRDTVKYPVNRETLYLRPTMDTDRGFLREVFFSTRMEEFAQSGLSTAHIMTLLAEQFELQDAYYRRQYPEARFDIVTNAGEPVGRLYHHWSDVELRIIDIALLPAQRGAKIGTEVMHALVARAAQRELPVSLYVEAVNPVKSLYQRLGFKTRGENGIYEQMRRAAAPFDGASIELTGL